MSKREVWDVPEGFRTEVRAIPGYDERDKPRGAGAHGLEMHFLLHCPRGVMQWTLNTMIMANPIKDDNWSIHSSQPPRRLGRPGVDQTRFGTPQPSGSYVAIHAMDKLDDYYSGPFECDVLEPPFTQCYQNIGYSLGDDAMEEFVKGGDGAVFRFLHATYLSWLEEAVNGAE